MIGQVIFIRNQTTLLLVQQLVARFLAGTELDAGPLPVILALPFDTSEEIDHLDVFVHDAGCERCKYFA